MKMLEGSIFAVPRLSAKAFLKITRPLPVATLLVSGDGEVLAGNKAARELFATTDFAGINFRDLVEDPQQVCGSLRLWATSRELLPASFQLRNGGKEIIRCDGAVLEPATSEAPAYLLVSCTPRNQAAATRIFLTLNETIAALQKRLFEEDVKQKERLNAFKTAASIFAHEIANPLNFMSTSLQFLERELKRKNFADPSLTSTLQEASNEIQRLSSLLDQFRMFTLPKLLDLQPINLASLVEEVVTLERRSFEGAGIAIDLAFTGAQPTLMLDRDKMKQVIINLCKNAHDAMPQGGRLTISGHQDPDQYFVLEFKDTGVGIPEGIDVFQLFTSTKSHGTGLGLPIVREIVSAHRGKIDYRSEPGKGTVFTIRLPTA